MRWTPALSFALAFIAFALPPRIQAQSIDAVIEIRRTFSSPACDSGEVLIDGRRQALFVAAPAFFSNLNAADLNVSSLATQLVSDTAVFGSGQRQALVLRSGDGARSIRMVMLNDDSFSPYERRQLRRPLPPDVVVMGYQVVNRLCRVSSLNGDPVERDRTLASTSDRLGQALFNDPQLSRHFPIETSKRVLVAVTDRSHIQRIEFAGRRIESVLPGVSADAAGNGNPCLSEHEHMSNTRIHTSGTTYQRRDDIVVCAMANIDGAPARETARDLRFILFETDPACGHVFGLPVSRGWRIFLNDARQGIEVRSECLSNNFTVAAPSARVAEE